MNTPTSPHLTCRGDVTARRPDPDCEREGCLFFVQCFAAGFGVGAVIVLALLAHFGLL